MSTFSYRDDYGVWEVKVENFDYPNQSPPPFKEVSSVSEHESINSRHLMTFERMIRAGESGDEIGGESTDFRPFYMTSPSYVAGYATKGVGHSHHKTYGTIVEGEISVTTRQEFIRVNQINILNPALADCTPSTTVTPISVFLFNLPNSASAKIQKQMSNIARTLSARDLKGVIG